MTEINYQQLSRQLKKSAAPSEAVYLLHGEQTLIEQCLEPLTAFLLQGAPREMNIETLDGLLDNVPDLVSQMNTFSFLSGARVVHFKDAKLFDSQGDQQRLLDQVRQELDADRVEKAAKALFSLCRSLGLSADNLLSETRIHPDLSAVQEAVGEDALRRMIQFGREKGWNIDTAGDPVAVLLDAIEKGFPDQHYLVITITAKIPKNRKFYKSIAAKGWIIDCSVPLGERKADKTAQEAVLRQTLERMLNASGKKMPPPLVAKLIQLTGFDLPVFIQNLEKLFAFTGDRKEITARDIDELLKRTKSDPVFELTNAVADRNAAKALSCLEGLLQDNWHPLQIVAVLANQLRKLLVAKDFTTTSGGVWSAGMSYSQFQKSVLPALKAFDERIIAQIAAWHKEDDGRSQQKKKKGAKKPKFDLALAANPYNAYPIYQTLVKSDHFAMDELKAALIRLSRVDVRLKSTRQDPAAMLTSLVVSICTSGRENISRPVKRRVP